MSVFNVSAGIYVIKWLFKTYAKFLVEKFERMKMKMYAVTLR